MIIERDTNIFIFLDKGRCFVAGYGWSFGDKLNEVNNMF